MNERRPQRLLDARRQADGELSDSDDEGEGGRRDHSSHRESTGPSVMPAGRRAAVGIMSAGSTHGAGPSVAPPVAGAAVVTLNNNEGSQSDMDIDDDSSVGQGSVGPRARSGSKPPGALSSNGSAMAVDQPGNS